MSIALPTPVEVNGRVRAVPADHVGNGFFGQHILSVKQFDRDKLQYIYRVADEMRSLVKRFGKANLLDGKILANLFYEPSTRTSSSFQAAMLRLGGRTISIDSVHYSSVTKGESLPDTVRTLESYCDLTVLRHPQVGAAAEAARYARKPLINAGDGTGEHPTQALLDIYTIEDDLRRLDGLKVAMMGDLKYGRTVHSLTRLLSLYDTEFIFCSPEILCMPDYILDEVRASGHRFLEVRDIDAVIGEIDVLYVTRVQKERFEDPAQYEQVKGCYVVDPALMARAKADMILMHPLPRVYEITMEVDEDPRAAYFRQMENGMYIRMALLAAVLGKA
ncbi:MAG: aspartate carbamoyltransferase [Anaerolineae bacterium]|nr:aspartate carbamoyltransferase [Anaerolineae bacterium]